MRLLRFIGPVGCVGPGCRVGRLGRVGRVYSVGCVGLRRISSLCVRCRQGIVNRL